MWLVAQPIVGAAHPGLFTLAFRESERATAARRDASYSSSRALASAEAAGTLAMPRKPAAWEYPRRFEWPNEVG